MGFFKLEFFAVQSVKNRKDWKHLMSEGQSLRNSRATRTRMSQKANGVIKNLFSLLVSSIQYLKNRIVNHGGTKGIYEGLNLQFL